MRPMQEATHRPGATDALSLWLGVNIKGWLGVNKRHSSSTVVIVFLRCPPLHVWAVTWEYTFSSCSQKFLNKKQTGVKKRTKLFRQRNVRFNKRFYFFFFVNCMFGFVWICPHCLTFRVVGIFGMVKDTITVNLVDIFFSLVW